MIIILLSDTLNIDVVKAKGRCLLSNKLVNFEWMDLSVVPQSYEDTQKTVVSINNSLGVDEKRWRIPSQHELQLIFSNYLPGFGPTHSRYWCRSSMSNGTAGSVDSKGKLSFIGARSILHVCIVR